MGCWVQGSFELPRSLCFWRSRLTRSRKNKTANTNHPPPKLIQWGCWVYRNLEIADVSAKGPLWPDSVGAACTHAYHVFFHPPFSPFKNLSLSASTLFLVSTSTAEWPAKPGFIFWLLNHSSFQFQLLNTRCCPAKSLYPVIKSPINLPFSSFISCNMTTQGSPSRLGKRQGSAFHLLLCYS